VRVVRGGYLGCNMADMTGVDPQYLRDVQYKDPAKLTARADLHARYGTAPVGWPAWVRAQIDWPVPGDVLEVGCGPGWLWADADADLPVGLRLTLTDLSPGMVEAARHRVTASSAVELADARVADAQELPFGDDAFDVVIANHMLYHLPDPGRAVTELARVLRPGGTLVAATNGPRHLCELWQIRSEVFGGPPTSRNTEIFGTVTGRAILGRSFAAVKWREYEDTLRCTDPDDVVAFLTSASPGEDASPDQLAELRRVVDERFDTGGGVFTVSKETGVLLARGARPPKAGEARVRS
jgi:SAM-dependent methyltransferase